MDKIDHTNEIRTETDSQIIESFIPIVDLNDKENLAEGLISSMKKHGFFYLQHGDEALDAQIEQMFQHSKTFYEKEQSYKDKFVKPKEGYGVCYYNQPEKGLETSFLAEKEEEAHDLLPETTYKSDFVAYCSKMNEILIELLKAIATGLKVEETDLTKDYEKSGTSILNLAHYKPLENEKGENLIEKEPTKVASGEKIRLINHTDNGILTLLAPGAVTGLQVYHEERNTYVPVEAKKGCLICNIGDLLQRMTNDTFISTKHRVVGTGEALTDHRYSIVYIAQPHQKAIVKTLSSPLIQKKNYFGANKYPEKSFTAIMMAKYQTFLKYGRYIDAKEAAKMAATQIQMRPGNRAPTSTRIMPNHDDDEETYLHHVTNLLERGLDPSAIDMYEKSILLYAVSKKWLKVMDFILEQKCDMEYVYYQPLIIAARLGDAEMFQKLINAGAQLDSQDFTGNTPLHWIVSNDDVELFNMMKAHSNKLEKKIELNLKDWDHDTIFHTLAHHGRLSLLKKIIKYALRFYSKKELKTIILSRNYEGNTAIHEATKFYRGENMILNKLMSACGGRQIELLNLKNNFGYDALALASREGHSKLVEFLLRRYKMNPECVDLIGNTPFLLAAQGSRHLSTMKILLDYNAQYDVSNNEDCNALMLAMENGQEYNRNFIRSLYHAEEVDDEEQVKLENSRLQSRVSQLAKESLSLKERSEDLAKKLFTKQQEVEYLKKQLSKK